MKTKLLLSFILLFSLITASQSQVPQGFNYQAIARDAGNALMTNKALTVKITIQNSLTTGTVIWQETHSVTTDAFGVFSLVVGTGTRQSGTATLFSGINWIVEPLFIKTEVNPGTGYITMGTTKLNSVPYALVADKANGVASGSKLSVVSSNDTDPAALFEVKRSDGQTVFAVYPDAVNIYVPRSGKGAKGGFAIGGFDATKANPEDYFRVTPDSVRVYIDPTPAAAKGSKGGFAIGGYGTAKGGINSMYFNLTGASSVNLVPTESPQILWYPIKKAFLAGSVHIGAVDSVGQNSTALGYRSIAMGDFSQAFGYKAKAFGNFSTSIGKNSVAGSKLPVADNAFALGNATQATGSDSYAFGSGAMATGQKSFAFGSVGINESSQPTTTPTTASGDYSVAFGMGAQATSFGAMALGANSTASNYAATTLGFYSQASGYYSVAIGYYSKAVGNYGHAFGLASEANGLGSLALGMYAKTAGNYAASMGYYAEAKNIYSIAAGFYAKAQADYSAAIGRSAITNGTSSVAVGFGATTAATATSAGAFGMSATANGPNSIAIGNAAVTGATATDASAFGKSSNASGASSMALGVSAKSPGNTATAIGFNADATGDYSFAIGTYGLNTDGTVNTARPTKTLLSYSMAIGMGAQSSLKGDISFGVNSSASGGYSTAIGYTPSAGGQYSAAFGYYANSGGIGSMAMGYNASSAGNYSASLGFGTTAVGTNATSIGYYSRANGNKSLAIGAQYNYTYYRWVLNRLTGLYTLMPYTVNKYNTADGDFSVAIGNGNQSTDGGITLGSNNTAIGSGAVAIGHTNAANSANSFVGGSNSQANGYNAIALGENLNAISANSFVIGSYNVTTGFDANTSTTWVETDPLFQIGNGESGTPHDAVKVQKNGGTYINAENAYAGLWVKNNNTSANPNASFGIGLMAGIDRNKAGLTYYSGYFYSMGGSLGTYLGEYADIRSGGAIDVAEYIYDSNNNTSAADVVVADVNSKESVVKSSKPYQSGVVGVISTKPHMTMGMELVIDEKTGELLKDAKPATRLALTGRVPVNVSGENGAIQPGDYLTTSSLPGTAMKWTLLDVNAAKDFDDLKRILSENEKRRGAIIGKAVESFNGSGTGKIVVLISLQ